MSQLDHHTNTIRNVSICGDFASGKSTLCNLLINNYDQDNYDSDNDQTTYKTQYYSMNFQSQNEKEYSINLLDCPGRLELLSEVNKTLRMSDGCLLVADYNNLGIQSEMVLRQAVSERLRSVLLVNQLDVLLRESKDLEQAYISLVRIIEAVNVVICTYGEGSSEEQVWPKCGTVAFGSVLNGWAFTLRQFAKFYTKKFGMDEELLVEKLWGDNYCDSASGEWVTDSRNATLQRSFCQFVLKPIQNALLNSTSSLEEVLTSIGIDTEAQSLKEWLPASDCILNMIVEHLPSPGKAQQYRAQNLYTGLLTDTFGESIKNCNPDGPLMIHITKSEMINNKVYAMGRIFSGKLEPETLIRIIGPNKVFEEKTISGLFKINGSLVEPLEQAKCGSIIGIAGIEKFLTNKGATITESSNIEVEPFSEIISVDSPMINISVEPKYPGDLPNLIKRLALLANCDPLLEFNLDEYTGEKILGVSNEIHFQSTLAQFNKIVPAIEIEASAPTTNIQETITTNSLSETLVKSPNKHNRFYLTSEPLSEELVNEIEQGKLKEKKVAKYLTEDFGWSLEDARKIYAFGPNSNGTNVFVDQTMRVQYVNEIKDSAIAGFQYATKEGPLCGEKVRGVRFNLKDVTMVSDGIHRGAGQIIPTVKRGCHACILNSEPTLAEPVFLGEFKCKESDMITLYTTLNQRRAMVIEQTEFNSFYITKGFVPISESFGIYEALKNGGVFSQFIFSHWQAFPAPSDRVLETIANIRQRKGLTLKIPTFTDLADRL